MPMWAVGRDEDCEDNEIEAPDAARAAEDYVEMFVVQDDPLKDEETTEVFVKHPNGDVTKHVVQARYSISYNAVGFAPVVVKGTNEQS